MLSVFLRATTIIAVIFCHSPHRTSGASGFVSEGLRKGFNALGSDVTEATPMTRLWRHIPPGLGDDAAAAIARETAAGWLKSTAAAAAAKAVGLQEAQASTGPARQAGPRREARVVYP